MATISMKPQKFIWVTFQRVGYHRYPDAPEDVNYLADRHRHLFKFKVAVQVTHDNRQIEFHQFLNWLESQIGSSIELNNKSCEMLSDDIANLITAKYGDLGMIIEVSEDGECGSTAYYNVIPFVSLPYEVN
jgi:hypothetical protein